jgi:hypothetical protein
MEAGAMRIAVLGCGPAGLLAAHAIEQSGHMPIIYSIPARSQMSGAMYLHEPIPGLTDDTPDFELEITKVGTREGYARKVYGAADAPVSWDLFKAGTTPAWSLSAAYDRLWKRYEAAINPYTIGPAELDSIVRANDIVFSSIPAWRLCTKGEQHFFNAADIWVKSKSVPMGDDSVMMYSGDPHDAWYRMSLIQNLLAVEYGHFVTRAMKGSKPIATNCDCRPEIRRIGRFGKWKKGVLTHHTYSEVLDAMQSL